MDGRTAFEWTAFLIALSLFGYSLYCTVVAHAAERRARVDRRRGHGPGAPRAARLGFASAACLGFLALTPAGTSLPDPHTAMSIADTRPYETLLSPRRATAGATDGSLPRVAPVVLDSRTAADVPRVAVAPARPPARAPRPTTTPMTAVRSPRARSTMVVAPDRVEVRNQGRQKQAVTPLDRRPRDEDRLARGPVRRLSLQPPPRRGERRDVIMVPARAPRAVVTEAAERSDWIERPERLERPQLMERREPLERPERVARR